MKRVKPVLRKHKPSLWAYAYLDSLRQQLGNEAFEAEVRKTAIDMMTKGLISGKKVDEQIEILQRAFEVKRKVKCTTCTLIYRIHAKVCWIPYRGCNSICTSSRSSLNCVSKKPRR